MIEYHCSRHPDRESIEPIAYRRCAECKGDATAWYADHRGEPDYMRYAEDMTTWGVPMREARRRQTEHNRKLREEKE